MNWRLSLPPHCHECGALLRFDEISYSWICDVCTHKTASTVRKCQFCGGNLEYGLKQDTWICVGCHREPTPVDLSNRSERFTWATSRSLLAETIDVDKTPDSCYQYAIKTMQRLGAVPRDQDSPVAFDFRFVETGDREAIFVWPTSDSNHSSVTVCLGAKSQPEQIQRMRGLAKQIIVEMNPPEAVTVRHTDEVVQYGIATSFSLDSNGALLIRCPHCGAQKPKADRDREVNCPNCGQAYLIPQKLLRLI